MSFPRNLRSFQAANAWTSIRTEPGWEFRDADAPFLLEAGPTGAPYLGYPGWYHPGVGYLGLDRQAFHVDWIPGFADRYYGLTLATAPDFLLPPGYRDPAWWDWTLGLTVKLFENRYEDGLFSAEASGIALDLGAAWRTVRIPFAPGVEAVAGAALLNLGGPVRFEDAEFSDPLPEQWRLGWSLAWKPFRSRNRDRPFHPLALTVTQELRREFYNRDPEGNPRPFPASLFHDLFRRPGEAWRERSTHMGAEVEVLEMASLRVGRTREGYYRAYRGEGRYYAWGWGISSGPWLGPLEVGFDFARYLRFATFPQPAIGSFHQKSLQARLSW